MNDAHDNQLPRSVQDHRRQWRDFRYVYPVVSRRSKGLSIGVNVNRDQRCSFGCLYCQVDRAPGLPHEAIDLDVLREELEQMLREAASGAIWEDPRFGDTPQALRALRDIAFSGDGEPTCVPDLGPAIVTAAAVRDALGLRDVQIILFTNAATLDDEHAHDARRALHDVGGEVWAKLDAGTEAYFRTVNRPHPSVKLDGVVRNILREGLRHPVVIQTLFCRLDGALPPDTEIDAYAQLLHRLLADGAQIRLVQIHTIARRPASATVEPLSPDELHAIAARVRTAIPTVPVETYAGAAVR